MFGKRHMGYGTKESQNHGGKKPRVVWSVEMEQRFVSVVNALGSQEPTPTRISSLMNIEGVTGDHVRGRLESYRSRLRMGFGPMLPGWPGYPAACAGQLGQQGQRAIRPAEYPVPVHGRLNPVGQRHRMADARAGYTAPRGWFPPPPAGPPPAIPPAPPLKPPPPALTTDESRKKTAGKADRTKTTSRSGMSKNAARTAAIAINARLGKAVTVEDILGVLAQVDVDSPAFDGVCVATTFHKLAKRCASCVRDDGSPSEDCKMAAVRSEEFQCLMRAVMVKDMKIRNLGNVLWSCAKMMPTIEQCKDLRQIVGKLVSSVGRQLASATEGKDTVVPQNLSNIMWSLPELRVVHFKDIDLAACIAQIERHVVALVARFEPQHISNTLLAFAKLSHRPARETMDALEAHISNTDRDMWTPQALSNSLYALGSLNARKPLTIHKLLVASMRKADKFSPTNAAISLKGLAISEEAPNDRIRLAAKSVPGCLERLASIVTDSSPKHPSLATPQNLSDTAWSLARLGVRDKSIFETIWIKYLGQIQGADLSGGDSPGSMQPTPSSLINMIWACGKVDISLPDAFKNWATRYLNK